MAPKAAVLRMAWGEANCPYHCIPWLLMPRRTRGLPASLQSWVPSTRSHPFSVTPPRTVSPGAGTGAGRTGRVWPRALSSPARRKRAQASARLRWDRGLKFPLSSPLTTPAA